MVYFGGDARLADGRTAGRGGVGLAYRDSLNANVTLPTQLPDVQRVTVTLASQFERRDVEDPNLALTKIGLASPTLRLALPMGSRMGFGTGFQAHRTTQWTVVRRRADDPTAVETIEREGTLFSVPLELGVQLLPHVRAGGGVLLEWGTIRERYSVELPGDLVDPRDVREDAFRSAAPELAAAVYDVLGLSVGGFWIPERDAHVEVSRQGVALDAREDTERTDRFPMRWGVGGKLIIHGPWSVGVDFEQERWSQYRGRPSYEEALRDETVVRAGIEREIMTLRDRSTPLRVGGYLRSWNYELEGEPVQEWGVALGTSFRLLGAGSRADIALGYSEIGTVEDNGIRERVLRLTFSFTGGERWY
jgi:hypothetical protein